MYMYVIFGHCMDMFVCVQRLRSLLRPSSGWGPRRDEHRKGTVYDTSCIEATLPLTAVSPTPSADTSDDRELTKLTQSV